MEKSYNNLIIIGDPIIDFYIDTKSNSTETIYDQREGGALNVFKNCKHLHNLNTYFFPSEAELLSLKVSPLASKKISTIYEPIYYYILRINNQKDLPLANPKYKSNFYSWIFNQRKYDILNYSMDIQSSGLVLSDYNKGTLNKDPMLFNIPNQFKFCVVDTRYRSLNLDYLKLSKINIWRCTGEEYNEDFAKNFDYIVWTNAELPVKILDKKQNCLAILDFDFIPKEKVKDTCGAGDTFTASLASFLNCLQNNISLDNLKKACYFSLECCQEVIQSQKTSITTKKINI